MSGKDGKTPLHHKAKGVEMPEEWRKIPGVCDYYEVSKWERKSTGGYRFFFVQKEGET